MVDTGEIPDGPRGSGRRENNTIVSKHKIIYSVCLYTLRMRYRGDTRRTYTEGHDNFYINEYGKLYLRLHGEA